MKKKKITIKTSTYNFLFEIIFKNKLIIFSLLTLAIISSCIAYVFQPVDVQITKNLKAVNKISSTNVLFKKLFIKPEDILKEYVDVLKMGVDQKVFDTIIEKNKYLEITFYDFEKFRHNLKIDRRRNYDDQIMFSIYINSSVKTNFRDRISINNLKDQILEDILFIDKKFVQNLQIIDELIKYRVLNYIKNYNALLSSSELYLGQSNNDYHFNFKVDNSEIKMFKNLDEDGRSLISSFTYKTIDEDYGLKKNSFVSGTDSLIYSVKTFKFSELIVVIFIIYFVTYVIYKTIRVDKLN